MTVKDGSLTREVKIDPWVQDCIDEIMEEYDLSFEEIFNCALVFYLVGTYVRESGVQEQVDRYYPRLEKVFAKHGYDIKCKAVPVDKVKVGVA